MNSDWIERLFARLALLPLLLASAQASADTEIHRCVQEDGSVSFQETPCPEPAPVVADDPGEDSVAVDTDDDFFDFENPFDQPPAEIVDVEPSVPVPSEDRAECEKLTRDAIDVIDREMQQGYSEEQGQEYLARLMVLTEQLRACKTL